MNSYSASWFNRMSYSSLESYVESLGDLDYNTFSLFDYEREFEVLGVQSAIDVSFEFFSVIIIVLFLSYFVSQCIDFIKKV